MKFSCEKAILNEAISICIHAVSSKSSIAVLEGILVSAEESTVTLSGYNFKTGIKKSFGADITEPGVAVLNARILSDIVRKLPDDVVEVAVDDRLMANIRCGSSEFNIIASSAQEFPELPEVEKNSGITLPNSLLKNMISDTIFAISDNENKPIHTGSLFEVEENHLTVVSVDGYRLAVRREEITNNSGQSFHFVVPGETLKEISRILPDDDELTSIYPERKHALFEFDETLVTTRLLEGEFLNYKTAIPNDHPIRLKINVKSVITSVERVSLIISERLKNPVRCIFDGESLKLSCITALGRSYDECPIPECPETIEIGFNNRYLLDALKACPDEECMIELKSGLSPCTIRPVEGDQFVFLVLPVRLKAGE